MAVKRKMGKKLTRRESQIRKTVGSASKGGKKTPTSKKNPYPTGSARAKMWARKNK